MLSLRNITKRFGYILHKVTEVHVHRYQLKFVPSGRYRTKATTDTRRRL